MCGSDVHTIGNADPQALKYTDTSPDGGWGKATMPLCVGHEVVGKAIKVGPKVTTIKVGDRVGVGAQIQSCLECKNCKSDNENYCPQQVGKWNPSVSKARD